MPALVTIADDFTGAGDQAGMLAEAGVRSLLVLDPEYPLDPRQWDAVTYASRLRSVPAREARSVVADLYARAGDPLPHMIQYKYCSTFDSTPEGNIGPCLDMAGDMLAVSGTVVVPALPVNGRTTYMGYHFVHGVPLHESPMSRHPLNPMADSNLLRWLGLQTPSAVGLVNHDVVRQGPERVRDGLEALWEGGTVYAVVDCICQEDVRCIAEAVWDLPFISGSSALAMELPAIWREKDILDPEGGRPKTLIATGTPPPTVALSGSCAAQTLRQVEHASGFTQIRVDTGSLLGGELAPVAGELTGQMARVLKGGGFPLVTSSQPVEERAELQARALAQCLSARDLGLRIEQLMGMLAKAAVEELGVRRVLVAGGETSGAVCEALGLRAVEILAEIDPGVPLCRSVPDGELVLALKGGNFGADDFFEKAARMGG